MIDHPTVFIVDDDQAMRDSLALLARSAGLASKTYECAQAFLDDYRPERPGCVLTDLRMPGMSGLELQEYLRAAGVTLPLVILTAHGDVPAAVRAMKHGALDFLEKPFESDALLDLLRQGLRRDAAARQAAALDAAVAKRRQMLTPREREVLALIVEGRANKVIAIDLGISERTVEIHRSRIMHKMKARSVAQLIRMVLPRDGDAGINRAEHA